ncbi:hypothetical protein BH10PSE8_BH10PSE8_01390 [soil metagenome]
MSDRCLTCGKDAVELRVETFDVKHAGETVSIQDERMVCQSCGVISYLGAQASKHELAVAAAIREMDGLLSAEDLRRIRAKYKFLQTDMEQILSTGPKTWTRWERGKIPQSKPTDKLLRMMAEDPDLAHRLMMLAGVVNAEAEAEFQRIENDAKMLARARLRAGSNLPAFADAERYFDQVIEASAMMRDARRDVAAQAEAA